MDNINTNISDLSKKMDNMNAKINKLLNADKAEQSNKERNIEDKSIPTGSLDVPNSGNSNKTDTNKTKKNHQKKYKKEKQIKNKNDAKTKIIEKDVQSKKDSKDGKQILEKYAQNLNPTTYKNSKKNKQKYKKDLLKNEINKENAIKDPMKVFPIKKGFKEGIYKKKDLKEEYFNREDLNKDILIKQYHKNEKDNEYHLNEKKLVKKQS